MRLDIVGSMRRLSIVLAALAFSGVRPVEQISDRTISALAQDPAVKSALSAVKTNEPQTIETQIRLSEIPAPPFQEAARADEVKRLFQQAGLARVRLDRAGNVIGERPG